MRSSAAPMPAPQPPAVPWVSIIRSTRRGLSALQWAAAMDTFRCPDRATSGDVLGGHVGAYGVATWGALYAAGVLSYSRFDEEVRRTIAGVGATETASGRFASDLFGARLELGRSYALPWLNVTPFAAVQTSTLWQRGFSETTTAGGLPGILGLTLSIADHDLTAYFPRRATRHPLGAGERHGLVAIPASGMGARVQPRPLDRRLVRVGSGYAVRGRWRACLERRAEGQCRLAARAQSIRIAIRQLRRRVCQQRL